MVASLNGRASRGRVDAGQYVTVVAKDTVERRRIERVLQASAGITILAAESAEEEVAADVVVLACDPASRRGAAEIRRFATRSSGTNVVVISPVSPGRAIRRALSLGARGLVYDRDIETALGAAVHAASAGYVTVPRAHKRCVERPELSSRQREVLRLAVMGRSNAEIAQQLFLSESTVKTHLSAVFRTLGVHSRREAAALILDPEEALLPLVFGPEAGLNASQPGTFHTASSL